MARMELFGVKDSTVFDTGNILLLPPRSDIEVVHLQIHKSNFVNF